MLDIRAPLPTRVRVLYGVGGMADAMKRSPPVSVFYTTVRGLPGKLVGLAAALSLAWDSFIDPFIGRMSDRTLLGRPVP